MRSTALWFLILGFASNVHGRDQVDSKKLLGVWEITRINGASPGESGGTMLLGEDGSVIACPTGLNGAALEGTYSVDGNQITTRFRAIQGREVVATLTVKRLSGDKMVLTDERNQEVEYRKKKK